VPNRPLLIWPIILKRPLVARPSEGSTSLIKDLMCHNVRSISLNVTPPVAKLPAQNLDVVSSTASSA